MGNYFPHDIIIFPLDYKIGGEIHNLHVFCSMKFTDVFGLQ